VSTAPLATDAPETSGLAYEAALDGLRGVAIAGVVAYHACAQSGLVGWVRGGFIGVSVFFTLSGFLITSLLLQEHATVGRVRLGRFVSRRIRRLSPALLVTVLCVVVLSAVDVLAAHASDAAAAAWSVTNWHVIAAGEGQLLRTIVGPLGPTWSLGVEEQLYVLLVVAVLASLRTRRPERTLSVVAIGATAVSVLLAVSVSDWNPRLEFGTDVRASEVAVGVLLAALVRSGWLRLPRAGRGDLAAAVGLAAIVSAFFWVDLTPPWLLRGGYTLLAIVSAATIVGLLAHGRMSAAMSTRPLVGLGRISYSLYLVHWPVMSVLTRSRTGTDGVPLVVLQVGVALGVAVALHLMVEQPVRGMRPTPVSVAVAAHVGGAVLVTALAVVLLP
jgi:peptidoglycan/LPS O-acetylase OafA/YrhL